MKLDDTPCIPTHRHRGNGKFYEIIADAKDCTNARGNLIPVVVYRDMDGNVWVRATLEFIERFDPL